MNNKILQMEQKKAPASLIYTLMCLMIISGSINTISTKLQNNSISLGIPYHHVWFITFCMFLGESTCMIGYFVFEKEEENQLPKITPFHLAIPMICDLLGTTIMTFGLTLLAGSVYQMFRGSLILFTAIFSIIFLKNILYRHHYLGLVSTIIGLILVGFAANLAQNDVGEKSSWVGIVLVIVAQVFSASQYIIEENYMKRYNCHPLRAIGWEGIWGVLVCFLLLVIFQFISCIPPPPGKQTLSTFLCSKNNEEVWTIENSLFALKQIWMNKMLLFLVVIFIICIGIYNFVGISISKYASSTARAVVDSLRTVVVWAFFMMPFHSQEHRENFYDLQLFGFILVVFGTIVYNEIIEIPYCGFNVYTKANLEKSEKNMREDEEKYTKKSTDPSNVTEQAEEQKRLIERA